MHIPDNYLSPQTCAVMGAAMVPVWAVTARKVTKELSRSRLPALGIGAAFSFVVMMFNIPVPGGTTAHAVGGTLLAVLLGPSAATISITTALLIQAVLFGDGGILSFAANAFNIAFIIPVVGYFTYRSIKERLHGPRGEYVALAIGSYIAINIAALFAGVEFGVQPLLFRTAQGLPLYCPYPLAVSVPAMLIAHLTVAGVAEAAFTVAVFMFVKRVSPETIFAGGESRTKPLYALLLGLVALSPLGLLAPGTAWGEWGVHQIGEVVTGGRALGFVPTGMERGIHFESLLQDYAVTGLPDAVGYLLSAVAGAAILVITFKLVSLLWKGSKGPAHSGE